MTLSSQFQSSKYPEAFDSDTNLFLVHDSLRVVLSENYNPDIRPDIIYVSGDTSIFPPTGIITLTEQCSDPKDRAVSFTYTTVTSTTFEGLVLLPGFQNTIIRPSGTHVTQNVMSYHHNAEKNALIAIQEFVGVEGTVDATPLGDTITGRLNFMEKLILSPKVWFTANKTVGLVPFDVEFQNQSFRTGPGTIDVVWDLGDETSISNISSISVMSFVPISAINVSVTEVGTGTITKEYITPGNYSVKLTVTNDFGSDTLTFENFINARSEAPIPAVIDFNPTGDQQYTAGTRIMDGPSIAGPWETPPKIKSKTNKFISISINGDEHYLNEEDNTQRSDAGEELDLSLVAIDPIENYEWTLSDDLNHKSDNFTNAAYTVGGIYDLILKVNTSFGAYRITKYPGAIDIIEDQNMFLFTLNSLSPTNYEYGLISGEFKIGTENSITLDYNDSFLTGSFEEQQGKFELSRNVGFTSFNTISSGYNGSAVIAYATGGSTPSVTTQRIKTLEFSGFSGLLAENSTEISRPWNWVFLPFETKAYFAFGTENAYPQSSSGSPSYQYLDSLLLGGELTTGTGTALTSANYINGADELGVIPNAVAQPKWCVYRSAVQNSTGYILRNEAVGIFFRLASFYRTEGIATEPLQNIRKLQDISGPVRTEGQLVSLNNGIFFFNNTGSVSAFNTVSNTWENLSITASVFKNFQDTTVGTYAEKTNTLLATSDGNYSAYLSFDYSNNSFLKFNSVDNTFIKLNPRPQGEQWLLSIY